VDIHKLVEATMKVTEEDMITASEPEPEIAAEVSEPAVAERPEVTPELIDSLIAEIPELAECDKEALLRGVTVEMEHFDVVGGDVSVVAKLACGHIQEFPGQDYYAALEEMEQGLRDVPEEGGEETMIDGEEDATIEGEDGQFEGRTIRGKRTGTGPFKNSRQRGISKSVGKRKLAGEKCPIVTKKKKVVKEDIESGEVAEGEEDTSEIMSENDKCRVIKLNSPKDMPKYAEGSNWFSSSGQPGDISYCKKYMENGWGFYIIQDKNEQPLYIIGIEPTGKRKVFDAKDNFVSIQEVPKIMQDLGVNWEYNDNDGEAGEEPVETEVVETKKEDKEKAETEASDKASAKKELKSILRKIHTATTVDAVETALDRLAKHGVLKDTDASRLTLVKDEAARKIKKLEAGNKEETPESKTDEVMESIFI